MAKTRYLSEAEKREGRKHLYLQEVFNGAAYSWVGDTIVYLMAISLSASNIALGYIAAASHLTGLILPLVPRLFDGRNHIKVQSFVWVLRGAVCILYGGLFFISGDAAILLLLAVYTLFNVFRMMGVALHDSTMRTVSSASNRGRVVSAVNFFYQGSSVISRLFTTFFLAIERFSGLVGLLILQAGGIITNTLAAHQIAQIPSRTTIVYTPGRNVWVIFREAMSDAATRRRLILRWLAISVSVVFALTTPFLQVELGLSNAAVVSYSVVLALAVILASGVSKRFSDRLGSRPLVLFSGGFSLVTFVVWIFIPPTVSIVPIFLLGFATNFFVSLISILTYRLLTQVMGDEETVSFNSMVNFVIAIIALVVGLFSGFLADFAPYARTLLILGEQVLGNGYSFVFIFAFLLSSVVLFFASRLQEIGAYSSHAAAQVIFSRHGLRAVSMIERLERTHDPAKRRALLHSLGDNYNELATSELRQILARPFSVDKREAVRAIADRPRAELLEDLIRLARDDDSYVQLDAIAALGAYYNEERAKAVLLTLMQEGRWASVRSMASKSLARVSEGDEYLHLVNELSHSARHIDETIDFLIAKQIMDTDGTYLRDLLVAIEQGRSATYRQTRYAAIANMLQFDNPPLSQLYEWMNLETGEYLADFLVEARDVAFIEAHQSELLRWFSEEDWKAVRTHCSEVVGAIEVSTSVRWTHLAAGILRANTFAIEAFDVHDMLALLYFSYSLVKHS